MGKTNRMPINYEWWKFGANNSLDTDLIKEEDKEKIEREFYVRLTKAFSPRKIKQMFEKLYTTPTDMDYENPTTYDFWEEVDIIEYELLEKYGASDEYEDDVNDERYNKFMIPSDPIDRFYYDVKYVIYKK